MKEFLAEAGSTLVVIIFGTSIVLGLHGILNYISFNL